MDKLAITRSEDSLEKAKAALQRIEAARSFKEFESAWSDFLMSTGRIFTQLELGSKSNPKSFGWFSKKKGERRSDPLIYYMWHARNADEHGLEPVTTRESGSISIRGDFIGSGTIKTGPNKDETSLMITPVEGGRLPQIMWKGPRAKLSLVKDRNNSPINIPKEHIGAPLEDNSPLAVAHLYVAYIEAMLAEARAL